MSTLVLILLITAHFILSIFCSITIQKTTLLDSKKKKTNILLLWLIPFIWWFIIKQLLKKMPDSNRGEKHSSSNTFHESEKGFYGDTHN